MSINRILLISAALLLPLSACGGGDDDNGAGGSGGSGNSCPHDYSKFTPTAGVSLRNDLLAPSGVFRVSCTISGTCHGSETASQANLYLGPGSDYDGGAATTDQATLVFSKLVGVSAAAAPSLSRVAASDPENSFLMHKLDGCLDEIKDKCTGASGATTDHPCGDSMPRGNPLLSAADRDMVRSWIKNGAQNN